MHQVESLAPKLAVQYPEAEILGQALAAAGGIPVRDALDSGFLERYFSDRLLVRVPEVISSTLYCRARQGYDVESTSLADLVVEGIAASHASFSSPEVEQPHLEPVAPMEAYEKKVRARTLVLRLAALVAKGAERPAAERSRLTSAVLVTTECQLWGDSRWSALQAMFPETREVDDLKQAAEKYGKADFLRRKEVDALAAKVADALGVNLEPALVVPFLERVLRDRQLRALPSVVRRAVSVREASREGSLISRLATVVNEAIALSSSFGEKGQGLTAVLRATELMLVGNRVPQAFPEMKTPRSLDTLLHAAYLCQGEHRKPVFPLLDHNLISRR